jgi:hypothetical protein
MQRRWEELGKLIYRALKATWHLERFIGVAAPQPLIESVRRNLDELRAALGESLWSVVAGVYPIFRAELERERKGLADWENRCRGCVHWDGRGDDELSSAWCKHFERDEICKPQPCPQFVVKVVH